jgi:hypothetical protein
VWHGGKATHPLLGSSLPPPPMCAGLGETEGAPPPRRAGRGRSREPGAAGARTGAAEYIAGVNTYTTGGASTSPERLHARNTDATPPTGRPRLHRRPTVGTAALLLSSPPWSLSCDASRRRDASLLFLAWLLAVAPHGCRTATKGAPEPFVLLGAAVAVR